MDVKEAIETRRAYRALGPVEVTDDMIQELARAAQLMPSCFNNQPWRFVFARSRDALAKVHACMNKGNEWTFKASVIIAAFAKKENDCLIKEREYYLFDLGLAVAALMLRATELGLVAHPIAGFNPDRVREALDIPGEHGHNPHQCGRQVRRHELAYRVAAGPGAAEASAAPPGEHLQH